jgi:choline dehydrogenase-like flavoprotein
VSPDGIDLEDKWNASVHGTDGPLGITMAPYTFESDAMLAALSNEMPEEFPFNLDPASSGYQLGLGWSPSTIDNGARASSWTHYLRPVVNRTNLDIVMNTHVTRVLQTGWQDGVPEFRGIEYAVDTTGTYIFLGFLTSVHAHG